MSGKLTALKVRTLTEPGRYGDGKGLWLQVRDARRRSWLFRYALGRRQRQMGLGPADEVTLAEAREAALQARRLLREGIDPIGQKRAARAQRLAEAELTFYAVTERYLEAHEASWRNAKHRAQWRATLETYTFPVLGNLSVSTIATAEVMRVLSPIWAAKPETASRVRGRIEAVLDFARARDWRTGENPARWRGHVENMLPKRDLRRSIQHHAALPWPDSPAFWRELAAQSGVAALALRFTILTAARTGEVIGATWGEIDLAAAVWTVPGARMKAGREHRVPLTAAVLAVLREAAELRADPKPTAPVFPGTRKGSSLSNMAMTMVLRRMKRSDATVHGFRSTFRDWAAEATGYPREVAEAALAHVIGNKVEAAYRRGDLFEKRRQMMEAWASFATGE